LLRHHPGQGRGQSGSDQPPDGLQNGGSEHVLRQGREPDAIQAHLTIGVVPDPQSWERWPEAQALLEPARQRGDFHAVWEPDELLWAVVDGAELLACATAWLSRKGYVEVKLVGGRDRHRWLAELDRRIGAAAAEAGATRLTAIGRRGWLRELRRLGWEGIGTVDGSTVYQRQLG
jgi:hypothetical protein